MPEDKTAIRILSLLSLLHRDIYWPVERLAQRFGTTKRTIYRYLKDLEQMNYTIVKDEQNRYRIAASPAGKYLPEFDPDEYIFLREIVASTKPDHPLRHAILEKINENIQLPVIGGVISQQVTTNILETIQQAMHEGVRVRLVDYYSLRSDKISDRVIEPVKLIRGMRYILAVDVETASVRQFKTDRIGGAVKLKTKMSNHPDFSEWGVDDFYMNGFKGTRVKIGLTMKAANLLCEEYGVNPQSLKKEENNPYPFTYESTVYGMEGVGRFVMGLIDQVHVYGPERLKTYLRKKYIGILTE
jgi:predicted DNA-binding transcriptional regulator YafY